MPFVSRPAPLLAAVLAVGLLPALALARDNDAQRKAAAFQAVLDCRNVSDSAQRLACYDAAAARMGEAESKGDIVVIDRAQAQAAHRQAFGLTLPTLDFVTRALKPEDVNEIHTVLKSARADAYGHWTFVLEDGAVWRQIADELDYAPKAGDKVTIRKAALGSFKMSVAGQPTIKVHRDQ